jgi:hypothetical protein
MIGKQLGHPHQKIRIKRLETLRNINARVRSQTFPLPRDNSLKCGG